MIHHSTKLFSVSSSLKLTKEFSLVIIASLAIALMSQFELMLPFSPVPITLQTFAIMACGLLLGKVRGTISVFAYICEGALGLPFFAGGSGGVRYLLGPTGGYLLGFVFCCYLAGLSKEIGFSSNFLKLLLSLLIANISIYLFGLFQLSLFVPKNYLFQIGFYPFILGDLTKIVLLSLMFPFGIKLMKKR
jgi:biotin transporter BioY